MQPSQRAYSRPSPQQPIEASTHKFGGSTHRFGSPTEENLPTRVLIEAAISDDNQSDTFPLRRNINEITLSSRKADKSRAQPLLFNPHNVFSFDKENTFSYQKALREPAIMKISNRREESVEDMENNTQFQDKIGSRNTLRHDQQLSNKQPQHA